MERLGCSADALTEFFYAGLGGHNPAKSNTEPNESDQPLLRLFLGKPTFRPGRAGRLGCYHLKFLRSLYLPLCPTEELRFKFEFWLVKRGIREFECP